MDFYLERVSLKKRDKKIRGQKEKVCSGTPSLNLVKRQ